MKKIVFVFLITFSCLISKAQKYEPIISKEEKVTDTFYNSIILEDKYRWVENIESAETKDWLDQQKKSSNKYLTKAVGNTNSYNLIDKYAYIRYNFPQKSGNYYFSYSTYNMGVPALFYRSKFDDDPIILVDPNSISVKDKISLNNYSVSKDSKLLAYQFSRTGSDWSEIKVITIKSGIHCKDHLKGVKHSHISWMGNGFFYTTFSQNGQFGRTQGQKILYHSIGNEQESDTLVFDVNDSLAMAGFLTTSDERFFIINVENKKKKKKDYYYIDYQSKSPIIKTFEINLKGRIDILDSYNGRFIATTSSETNNGSIIEIDPENQLEIRTIVQERTDTILLKVIPYTDRMVAFYQTNMRPLIMIIDYNGNVLHKLRFPVASAVSGFNGNSTDEELLFSFTSYTIPPVVYKFNIKTFNKELAKKTTINFSVNDIEYKEVEYLSKDNVLIPMILVYKKGLTLDGNNPTILKAYGGFGIVSTPSFDPGIVYFINQGGVYAFARIRGGGDKGLQWAHQGRGKFKQKSFDDFISAAEYLIQNKYTNNQKLAATGGSNGGLVVAVAAIQRPDLFKVIVPVVAPLDMIRFEKFTVGHWWFDEYGTVEDSTSFKRLLSYSPYQNIREEVNYPAMLIVTSENDDRVPPFHSYKFAAKLQSRTAQKNPILLKNELDSGHHGSSTLFETMQAKAEIYGFIMNELTK